MPQGIADSPGSLLGQDFITTAATPLMGRINPYDATDGPLEPILRQASLGILGTTCLVKKVDGSSNAVTITCYAGEEFSDGTTTRTLTDPGSFLELLIAAVAVADGGDGVARWEVIGGSATDTGVLLEVTTATTLPGSSGSDVVAIVSGGVAVTLPTAVGNRGLYTIKALGTVTVGTTAGQTIDGSALPITLAANDAVDIRPFNGNWVILA